MTRSNHVSVLIHREFKDLLEAQLKLFRLVTHETCTTYAPKTVKRRAGIAALASLTLLFGSLQSSNAQTQPSFGCIGYCNSGAIIGAAVGVVAGVAAVVVIVTVNHDRHVLKGCVSSGPNGLELQTSDAKTYLLEGDPSAIKVGDLVKFHGSKLKQTKDSKSNKVFKVDQLKKDYGPCHQAPTIAAGATP